MELLRINNYYVTYQRNGNDKNGNPIYLINVFILLNNGYSCNMNAVVKDYYRIDRYGNIVSKTYNIGDTVNTIVGRIEEMEE